MVYLCTKNAHFNTYIFKGFGMEKFDILHGHLVYFGHFGILFSHMVFMWQFWYIFPRFGLFYHEKSGNSEQYE
jgi:hypothetical protein